jgi:hypothetical protein
MMRTVHLSTKNPHLIQSALHRRVLRLGGAGLLAVPLACAGQGSSVAGSENQLIDWYYAAFFGTGVYRAGDRTVSVLQLPFSKELQPMTQDQWGVRLTLPVSVGVYDYHFEDLLVGKTPHNLSTVSLLPGIEGDIPVTRNWTLKPYGNAGEGWDTSGGGAAWIYAGGVKSRVALQIGEGSEVSLGNQLTLSGYKPPEAPSQSLGLFVAGLNLSTPSRLKLWDHATSIDYHLIYYYYFNRLFFPVSDNPQNKLAEQSELGISLKTRTPVSLRLFDVDRIGIAFRVGDGVQGMRVFLSLPY